MLAKGLSGGWRYRAWLGCLLAAMLAGAACYAWQCRAGLGITGMGRDVSWGLYVSQFTFLVGVAASAVLLVVPRYLHREEAFARIVVLGEFLAAGAVAASLLFLLADLGQPQRALNVLLHPSPRSVLFWDLVVLAGYLLLTLLIGWTALGAEAQGVPAPRWLRVLVVLSVPWAVAIHTVTAFLYAGLPGRRLWMTAVLAPRFLASAFAAGPALLILLVLLLRRMARFDPGAEAIARLATIVAYALPLNLFLLGCELFTAFYGAIPEHRAPFAYLYAWLDGRDQMVPWARSGVVLAAVAAVLLVNPRTRRTPTALGWACAMTVAAVWIDKGFALVPGGFVPTPLGAVVAYRPTVPEALVALGIWAAGALLVTVLFKAVVAVREDEAA